MAWLLALAAWSATARGAAQPRELEVDAEVETGSDADAGVAADAGTAASPTPTVAPTSDPNAELATLRETIARLEARLDAVEAESAEDDDVLAYEDVDSGSEPEEPESWWDRLDLRVSGYIQTQLVTSQLSHDELGPDGTPLNQDRFVIRRGRLRVDRVWDFASLSLEIDGSTTRGPFVGIRRAEVSFFLPNLVDHERDPYVAATVGLTSTPFGFELRQPNRERWFMERSTGSLAFQRGEPDVGARLWGAFSILRYDVAIMNGNPLDDRAGGEPIDLTGAKDVIGRVGIETDPSDRFSLAAGVSFHVGTGLAPGTPATKPQLIWIDTNENGEFDPGFEVFTTPGFAATPSQTFRRWGFNVDLQVGFRTRIGWTRLYGEATVAENLDRSMYIANPVILGEDIREFAWYGAFLQEITPYAIVGFRADYYDPNSDLFEERAGIAHLRDASILTLSPMVGAQLPGRGRFVFQYDRVIDHLGRDVSGVPTDLKNDQFIFRLQMEF